MYRCQVVYGSTKVFVDNNSNIKNNNNITGDDGRLRNGKHYIGTNRHRARERRKAHTAAAGRLQLSDVIKIIPTPIIRTW